MHERGWRDLCIRAVMRACDWVFGSAIGVIALFSETAVAGFVY